MKNIFKKFMTGLKKRLKSKTNWVAIIIASAPQAAILIPGLQPFLISSQFPLAVGVVMWLLREVTNTPLSEK